LNDIPEADSEFETEDEVEVEEEPSSATKELKKMNAHMGMIEGKVTNLSKRYDELKEEKDMEEMV
jgi:predicted nuclease with TOPRIM domain